MTDERVTKFEKRREILSDLSDEQLKEHFWELCDQLVDPIIDLARTHTSPSIERSVLLRMGIDSLTAHGVVERVSEAGLLGKGAGHVVLKVSSMLNLDVTTAARTILDDKDVLTRLFQVDWE